MKGGVTVVIPVGPGHHDIVQRAIASVEAQHYPVKVITVYDHDRHGAGWARNRGLEQVTTEFVVFLDADDELLPGFLERTMLAFRVHESQGRRRYVYTDWWNGDTVRPAPECSWTRETWHCVTALLPTAWAREVGGFDETLPGAEDSDFYMKLVTRGRCGTRLAEPLFRYHKDGERSRTFRDRDDFTAVWQGIIDRYRGKNMSCCGSPVTLMQSPSNAPESGDVLVVTLWAGNRPERGRATGRIYPRSGNGHLLYVNPADVDAAPHLFARVTEPATEEDADAAEFQAFARQVLAPASKPVQYVTDTSGQPRKADVFTLMSLYKKAAGQP